MPPAYAGGSDVMWNDTEIPLAFLITFRCYGTWLHGDERGSVDRFHNQYKSAFIESNEVRRQSNEKNLKNAPVFLDAERREAVEFAIREVCAYKNWNLYAVNVRTNHVHTVVANGQPTPEKALNAFKAYATRKMREKKCWQSETSPWVDKGSNRYLWNEKSVELAIDYVINSQGDELPNFD